MIIPRSPRSILSCVAIVVVAAVAFPVPRAVSAEEKAPPPPRAVSFREKVPRPCRQFKPAAAESEIRATAVAFVAGVQSRRRPGRGRPLDRRRQRGR